jgi:negative regulator of sigma E activity
MNEEQLSALMDDELAAEASRKAVTQLLAEPESRATWGRYHLIGAALRSAPPAVVPAPDNVVVFPTAIPRPVSRLALGLAAAAAIAAFALIVSPSLRQQSTPFEINTAQIVPLDRDKTAASNGAAVTSPTQNASTSVNQSFIVRGDETQERMDSYVRDFNEQRARQLAPGVHPYVRIVGYETH